MQGNPTYNNGVATFNGSTDYYKLKTLINLGTKYSIEVKAKAAFTTNGDYVIAGYTSNDLLLDFYKTNNSIIHCVNNSFATWTGLLPTDLLWHTYTITRLGTSVLLYIDGIYQSTKTVVNNNCIFNTICALNSNIYKFNGQLEYIKIWNRQLSPSEVKNNYNGKTYRALPYKATTLFHINSDNGVIRDLTGKTTPVATNVALPKIGSNKAVMKFNGSSGNINLGSQSLVGDITFMGWVNNTDRGELLDSRIIDNSKLYLRHSSSPNKLFVFTRNNSTTISASAINAFKESLNIFICITSTSTGITNFYIGDKNNPPTLSGTANQSAGTPIAGSNCYLGNRASDDRTLNGWLNDIIGIQAVITQEEMMQTWSSTKYKYQ